MDETECQQAAESHDDGGGPARPRRADTETLTYLRSLEPLIDQSVKALDGGQRQRGRGHGGGEDEQGGEEAAEEAEEDRALLVSNLIDELTYKVGSLAMDRHAAPVLEKLARLCTRKQLARLLTGCQGYAHCLASNRYSSHVLQTFFSLAGPMVHAELEGVIEDDDDEEDGQEQWKEGKDGEEEAAGPVLLRTAAAALAQELQASWLDLLYDISGTHTLRALFCLLTGMPAIAERRGRHAKHRHAIETAVVLDAPGAGSSGGGSGGDSSPHAVRLPMHAVPDEFTMLLESLVVELSQLELMMLHQSLCDPHAGPALCLLVQAVARSEGGDSLCLQDTGPFMQGFVKRALCWAKPARCAEVVYAMAGEALGSRFLEAALWHSKPESLADPLFEVVLRGRLVEFAEHEVANFVVQTWLQRTRSSINLKAALEELAPAMGDLVRRRRAGVLWRLAGAAARLGKHEGRLVKAITAALAPEDKAAGSVVQALLSYQEGDSSGDGSKQQWSLRVREEDGRLQLNVPGARLLECLMRLPSTELARPFCEAILALPTQSLLVLAKDNVGSRTLLDPVLLFAAAHQEGKGLGDALMGKLKGHYADLAAHPVAFHVLTRCFSSCLALPGRKAVAEELLAAESRLAGAHFGRRALGAVAVSMYRSNRGKWEEAMVKGERKRQVLEELFGMLEEEKKGKGEGGKDKAAAGVQEEGGQAKKGKGKGKEKKEDALLALLMGKSEEGGFAVAPAAAAAAPSVAAAREKVPEGADLDFVLDALKKGGGKKGKKPKGKEGKGEVGAGSEEDSAAKPAKRKGPPKSKEERRSDRATVRGGGSGPLFPQQQRPREGETPVEKATRLLGKRALMSKTELLSAVGELEREVKKKGKR